MKFSHKKLAGIVGIIAVIALLLVGTFAWTATLNEINDFSGTAADKDLSLHDDYDPETGEKAVYAENTGKGVMFVRVRLDEFMDLTQNARPAEADINWSTHVPENGIADCELSNNTLDLFHDYFTWEFGGQKYYLPAAAGGIAQNLGDYTPDTGEAWLALDDPADQEKVKQTATFSHPGDPVIPMSQYIAATDQQRKDFIGWVYDTDGYAYWSQPLYQGDVTGLLLNKVTTAGLEDTDYYYAINVIAQAVDHADLGMWMTGAAASTDSTLFYDESTPSAKTMLNVLTQIKAEIDASKVVTNLEILTAPDKIVYTEGELFERTGLVIKVTFANGDTDEITKGFSHSPANPLRTDHTVVTFTYGSKTVTQAITVNPAP